MRDPQNLRIGRGGAIPAIVTRTRRKQFFEPTSFGREWEASWRELWARAANALATTEKLVVIGYSMPAADEAARALLFDNLFRNAEVSLWCGQSNEGIAKDFRERGFAVAKPGVGRFEDFLGSGSSSSSVSGQV